MGKDTGAEPNPEGGTVEALRAVLLYTLTDTFGLRPEESHWLSYELADILVPLVGCETAIVPLAVRQEMLGGVSSAALVRLQGRAEGLPLVADGGAVTASAEQWTSVMMSMIKTCYSVPPMVEVQIFARLLGALHDLGVDEPGNPRPSRYLPNDVRTVLLGESRGL